MTRQWIKNVDELATTPLRRDALGIASAGLSAIDTTSVIRNSVSIDGTILSIKGHQYDLADYERVVIIGFGKASCTATETLESLMGNKIWSGIVVGVEEGTCEIVKTYAGTHPSPSRKNVEIGRKITELSQTTTERDLVLVVVSGGGSALLCWPESECDQGQRLYEEFQHTGGTIHELNTIRKHISKLKGGGLVELLYPATVAAIIFSDILGNEPELVASGCTYKDETTVQDAQAIIDTYGLGNYDLHETPKDDTFFEKVKNIVICDNTTALDAMETSAKGYYGYASTIATNDAYMYANKLVDQLIEASSEYACVIAGAEPKFEIPEHPGTGGRNQQLALEMLPHLTDGQVFLSLASDGNDNDTKAAGAIVDKGTFERAAFQNMSVEQHRDNFDAYPLLETTNDLVITGPTQANVADLIIVLTEYGPHAS